MQLYNTRTKQLDEVTSRSGDGTIGMYICGPTVYSQSHIGHLRKYTMDDVIIRALGLYGLEVKTVENITDVGHLTSDGDTGEDKLEKGARRMGKTAWEVAAEFEVYFWRSMKLMGNIRPEIVCKATDHIQAQLEMVKVLEEKGFAYVVEGDGVYFDTAKFPRYADFAGLNLEEQQGGARVELVEGKRNPSDFALWKFERPGENRAMSWESPWAERSFPGWHIECSAMSMKYLGEQFEIHTGGVDHVAIHHTNEIAQSEAATGKAPFVDIWVNHNFLRVDNEKMSQSLGNVYTIDTILEKGFSPMALRLLFLMTHYRSELNFTWESLQAAQIGWDHLVKKVAWEGLTKNQTTGGVIGSDLATKFVEEARELLGNDLQTPQVVALMWKLIKQAKSAEEIVSLAQKIEEVLGLQVLQEAASIDKKQVELTTELTVLLEMRNQARNDKDWQRADEIRDKIAAKGYVVKDHPDGSSSLELSRKE